MTMGWQHLWGSVDAVFLFIMGISVVLLVGVTGVMIYFVFRFKSTRHPVAEEIRESVTLEITWIVVPTLLVLAMFFAGWKGFQYMRTVPDNAMLVKVTAAMWAWSFQYENGKRSGILYVPAGRPVKLVITSTDVLHSLSIPAFRIKEDAVPGRETYLWFMPDEAGSYDLFCTEYCGTGHSSMLTKVEVMPADKFEAWYATDEGAIRSKVPVDGAKLFREKGCDACHSLDGTAKVGPTLKGLFNRREFVITNGKEREFVVNDDYVRRSLTEPLADIVKGFPPIMPSQKGLMTDQEIDAVVEYLKQQK